VPTHPSFISLLQFKLCSEIRAPDLLVIEELMNSSRADNFALADEIIAIDKREDLTSIVVCN